MRMIVFTKTFKKKATDFLKRNPQYVSKYGKVLEMLEQNVFHASLKTHKLSGIMKGKYACSIDHSYRMIFVFDDELVQMLNVGTHDEVY